MAMLAVASCIVAALLEAGFLWARRDFGVWDTLGVNFDLAVLDFGFPPAWQMLALGLAAALAAAGCQVLRAKRASARAGQADSSTMLVR